MRKSQLIAIITCIVLSIGSLTACNNNSTSGSSSSADTSVSETTSTTTTAATKATIQKTKEEKITGNISVGYGKGQIKPGTYTFNHKKGVKAKYIIKGSDSSIKDEGSPTNRQIVELYEGDSLYLSNAYIVASYNTSDKDAQGPRAASPYDGSSEATDTESSDNATLGELNALRRAITYISGQSFSASRLKKQLKYEGYTDEEAQYGVDNCGADWNEEAAGRARLYLRSSAFSKQRLREQLEYEGFSESQIDYALLAVGY